MGNGKTNKFSGTTNLSEPTLLFFYKVNFFSHEISIKIRSVADVLIFFLNHSREYVIFFKLETPPPQKKLFGKPNNFFFNLRVRKPKPKAV